MIRRLFALTTCAVIAALVAAPHAAAAEPSGAACGPNEGVTVVVDFSPTSDDLRLGCAPGGQSSIGAAAAAAGFELTTELTGFGNYLCAIDGVAANAVDCQAFPGPYWSPWINTADGDPAQTQGTDWFSAAVGVDGGPLAPGTVIGFRQNTDGSFPGPTPGIELTDLPAPDNTARPVPAYRAGDASAAAAAGWIGRQFSDDGLVGGNVGSTVDAIYALAAAGVGGDRIADAALEVENSGSSYIGSAADTAGKIGQLAKTSLALQIAGLDPTSFPDGAGSRDLLADLRGALNADGSFGTGDEPFGHSYALLTLSRTAGGVPEPAVDWLIEQQCHDTAAAGSFGYGGCATADPDYTAVAVQALIAAGLAADDPAVAAALDWLQSQQAADGGLAGNTNSTGLAGEALRAGDRATAAAAAAGFIGGLQIGCAPLPGSSLTSADLGAVAWKPSSLKDAVQFGIDDGNRGEFQYASVQAVLGLASAPLNELTASGADAALPDAANCEPAPSSTAATTTSPPSTVTSGGPHTGPTAAAPTDRGRTLSATGAAGDLWWATALALVLITIGTLLGLLARRRPDFQRR